MEIAKEMAGQMHLRIGNLESQLNAICARSAKIEAEIKAAKFAPERALYFDPSFNEKYLCPHCWIATETRSPLLAISHSANGDQFRCNTCHLELSLPLDQSKRS
jgi:hypothetical protein